MSAVSLPSLFKVAPPYEVGERHKIYVDLRMQNSRHCCGSQTLITLIVLLIHLLNYFYLHLSTENAVHDNGFSILGC